MPSFDWSMWVELSTDEAEIRRALSLLIDPENYVQVQSLPSAAFRTIHGKDLDVLTKAVVELSGGMGTYITLNPIARQLDKMAKNGDIVSRRWLFIDIDSVKSDPKSSTTNSEKDLARIITVSIRAHLESKGWPEPIVVDSGNNFQLLYRIDLPNDRLSHQIVSRVLKVIGSLFNSPHVEIDPKVCDARRICKVPGTMARKGQNIPERPWRMARIISAPDDPGIVTIDMLQSLAGPAKVIDEAPHSSTDPWKMSVNGDKGSYIRSVIERELGAVAVATNPGRNEKLHDASWRIASFIKEGGIDESEMRRQLDAAGRACGLGTDGDPGEISRAIDNGFAYGLANPRKVPDRAVGGKTKTSEPKTLPEGLIIVRASSIKPRKVEWLWHGRIPIGKLTTFAGVGGLGKTFVLCDITARVTHGLPWPDEPQYGAGECPHDPGQVLFISGEDEPDDTLVPRMIELGADLDRIVFLKTEVQDRFTLADIGTLDRAIDQAGTDVTFVAIDPPTAYLGSVDDHKNAELRALLSPLKSWAAKRRVAIVFNTHVSKPQGNKVEAMMRVMGSVAWVNAVRAGHMFAKDHDDPTRRLFVPMKLNIGREQKGLAYRIVETETLAKIEWLGDVDLTADEAMAGERKKPRGVQALEWVTEQFRERREWPSDTLKQMAKEAGISKNSLWSPEVSALPIKKVRHQTADGENIWSWCAMPGWPPAIVDRCADRTKEKSPAKENDSSKNVGKVGNLGNLDCNSMQDNTHGRFPNCNEGRESSKVGNLEETDVESQDSRKVPEGSQDSRKVPEGRESCKELPGTELQSRFPRFPTFPVVESSGGNLLERDTESWAAFAVKVLVDVLRYGERSRADVEQVAREKNIPDVALFDALERLEIQKSWIDGQEYWDLNGRLRS